MGSNPVGVTKNKKQRKKRCFFIFCRSYRTVEPLGSLAKPRTANPSQTAFAFPLTRGRNPLGSPKTKKQRKKRCFFIFAVPTERSNPWVRSLAVDGKPLANCVCLPLNKGRKPVGVTKQVKGEPVSFRRRIRLYHIL